MLKIDRSTLYRMIKRHEIPCFRVGGFYRLAGEEIDRWRFAQQMKPKVNRYRFLPHTSTTIAATPRLRDLISKDAIMSGEPRVE